MADVRQLAEEYAQKLIDSGAITTDQFNVIIDAILYGQILAMQSLSNAISSYGLYFIPNPSPIKIS